MAFKKGQSGNPKGPAVQSPELKTVKHVRAVEVEQELNKLWRMRAEELKDAIKPEGKTCGELLLARAFYNAIQKADKESTNAILDRMVGKVKEQLKVESEHTIKIEHLKIHEVRQILQADPFITGGLEDDRPNPKHSRHDGSGSAIEADFETVQHTSGASPKAGSGEKRPSGSDQDSSGSE